MGAPYKDGGPYVTDRTLAILSDLFRTTDTLAAIARRHGCRWQWVQQLYRQAREAGLKVPERPPTKRK